MSKKSVAEFGTSKEAEQAFYKAFQSRDHGLMADVWDAGDEVACIHPMNSPVTGRIAVLKSWDEVFRGLPSVTFRVDEVAVSMVGDTAIHLVYERIEQTGSDAEPSVMAATNIYRRTEHGWKIQLHHASPLSHAPRRRAEPVARNLH